MILQADIDSLVAYAKLILPGRVSTAVEQKNKGYYSKHESLMMEAQYIYLGIKFFSTNTDATDLEKQQVYQCLLDKTGFYDVVQASSTLEQTGVDFIFQTEAKTNTFTINGTGTITIYYDTTVVTQALSGSTTFTIDYGYAGFKTVRMDFSNPETTTEFTATNNQMFGQLDLSAFDALETVNFNNNAFTGITFGDFVDNPNLSFALQYNELTTSRIGVIIDQISASTSAGISGRVFEFDFNAYASRDKITAVDDLLTGKAITVNIQFIPQKPEITVIDAASATEVSLEWLDYSTNENAFLIERSVDQVNWTEIAELAANTTSYTDSTVSEETTYYYRVRARAQSVVTIHYSEYSATAQVTTPSDTFPITVTGGNKQITVSWSDTYTGELQWEVLRASASEGPYAVIATEPTDTTSYLDSSLPASTRYWYQVRVVKSDGNTVESEIASAETNAGAFSIAFSSAFS